MRLKGHFVLQLFDPKGGGISIDNVSLAELKEFFNAKEVKEPEKKIEPKKVKKDEK